MDIREEMLTDAISQCHLDGKPIELENLRPYLPPDFFRNFDSGEPLDDATVSEEIKAAEPAPATKVESASVAADAPHDMVQAEPALSPQARLDAAQARERELIGTVPVLRSEAQTARAELAKAVRAYQDGGPRWTHEDLARDFIQQSNKERAARVAGEPWALRPGREKRGNLARVDAERIFSQGGDANAYARKLAGTANRRQAYSKDSYGTVNRDPSRGAVPPAPTAKATVPLLTRK